MVVIVLIVSLTLVSLVQPAVTIYSARKWRRRVEQTTADIRNKHLQELQRAKDLTNTERRRLSVLQSQTYLDHQIAQLACQEICEFWDEESEQLMYNGNWRTAYNEFKAMAVEHNQSWNKDNDAQLQRTYKVDVLPG